MFTCLLMTLRKGKYRKLLECCTFVHNGPPLDFLVGLRPSFSWQAMGDTWRFDRTLCATQSSSVTSICPKFFCSGRVEFQRNASRKNSHLHWMRATCMIHRVCLLSLSRPIRSVGRVTFALGSTLCTKYDFLFSSLSFV